MTDFHSNVERPSSGLSGLQSDILRACVEGYGVQAMLELAYQALQANICLCSTSLYLLSCYPPCHDSFFFSDSGSAHLPNNDAIRDFFDSGIPQRILAHPDTPFLAPYHDSFPIHLYCGVRIRKTLVAYLCVTWNRAELPDEIAGFVAYLSQMISLELQKNGFTSAAFMNKELILSDLLNNCHEQMIFALQQFPDLTEAAPYTYRLCAVHSRSREAVPSDLLAFNDSFLKLYPNAVSHLRDSVLYLLVPGLSVLESETACMRLRGFLHAYHLTMSCSNPIRTLTRLPDHLRQALALMSLSKADVRSEDPIQLFERFLPLCAFGQAYPNTLTSEWLHPHIQQLIEHDKLHQTNYIPSLAAYIRCGRSMQAAADSLYIHKTSLIYRFSRMQDLTEPFLRRPELLFLYEYSLRIMGLL